jgi:putative SOS response-associated peptidase YedK
VVNSSGVTEWEKTIRFGAPAPIIEKSAKGFRLTERIFPVNPFPNSRLSGFENQSDAGPEREDEEDKQIRRIYDVPRWKKAFGESPLLVPMTGFTEFAYWGKQAGSALNFKIPHQDVFFAAGITLKPFVPKTGIDNGFSLLTHTATDEMLQHHHRLIVLLQARDAVDYLEDMSARERFDFLIEKRYVGHLEVKKLRSMAKGWEKRKVAQEAKLKRETVYREVIRAEKIEG